jgi:type I restriction-modification system DNA methylase subunit
MTREPKLSKQEKKKQFGEVFTPPELVEEMLNNLPPEVWQDASKTWLDNSCGNGAFLVAIKNRLMVGLKQWQPDAALREKHILDNMIFGVELQADNWQECRTRLGLTPTGNDGNIVQADALTYHYRFDKNDQGGYDMSEDTFGNLFEF